MSIFPTRLLLATDGSKDADLATETAADLAAKTDSELHLLYVMPVETAMQAMSCPDASNFEAAEQKARELLNAQVERIKAYGVTVAETHLGTGSPEAEIVRISEETSTGLIVMGSRGLGGIRRAGAHGECL